jgi:hypothetical protein
MSMIDSTRLAAFRLGFHVRQLRSILGEGIKGKLFHAVPDVHPCRRAIEDAALVLATKFTSMESENLHRYLHQAGELHDLACGVRPEEEGESERDALGKLEQDALDHIDFVVMRVGRTDPTLAAWWEVGIALAELHHKVAYVYTSVPIPSEDWKQLNDAVDRLSPNDHALAGPFIFGMPYKSLSDLGIKLRDAYDDLCQCISSPDRQQEFTTPSVPVEVPPAPLSVELRGLGKPPLILGKAKDVLTPAQYNVIQALLDAGSGGLNKDELEDKSGHSDARKILKRVADSDPDWMSVIRLAGSTGKRYRIL